MKRRPAPCELSASPNAEPGAVGSIDRELGHELARGRQLDDLARLVRVGVHRVALRRDEIAIRGENEPDGAVEVHGVVRHHVPHAMIACRAGRPLDREDGVVGRRRHVEDVPRPVEREARRTHDERRRIAAMRIPGGDLRGRLDLEPRGSAVARAEDEVEPRDRAAQHVRDEDLRALDLVDDREIPRAVEQGVVDELAHEVALRVEHEHAATANVPHAAPRPAHADAGPVGAEDAPHEHEAGLKDAQGRREAGQLGVVKEDRRRRAGVDLHDRLAGALGVLDVVEVRDEHVAGLDHAPRRGSPEGRTRPRTGSRPRRTGR